MNYYVSLLHSGAGDWVGLYINNILVMEDHNLSEREILEKLATIFDFSFENLWDEKEDYLDRFGGRCPENLPSPDELK